jgi:hypothetical protein
MHRDFSVFPRRVSQDVTCHSNSVWPQVSLDSFWPSALRVKQHRSCHLLVRSNVSLSNAVLPVCIDAAKRLCLLLPCTIVPKQIIWERTSLLQQQQLLLLHNTTTTKSKIPIGEKSNLDLYTVIIGRSTRFPAME